MQLLKQQSIEALSRLESAGDSVHGVLGISILGLLSCFRAVYSLEEFLAPLCRFKKNIDEIDNASVVSQE